MHLRLRRSLLLWLLLIISGVVTAQAGTVRVVAVNEFLNIRLTPAIGAPVLATVPGGTSFEDVTARSGDGEWLRVQFECAEGWISTTPIIILEGDVESLPVADPRSIPFGGFDAPRAGFTERVGTIAVRATDGLRVRSGPSTAYPTIAGINFNQQFTLLGRNPCATWLQVNFGGILGWVSGAFIDQLTLGEINNLPVGGVVADDIIVDEDAPNELIGTLALLRDRLDLATPSLNQIRSLWTDAAVVGRAVCQGFPSRPSDFAIPSPVLSANFVPLNALVTDFNTAMSNVRTAIDLYIEVCNLPGTANPVGQATAQGALNFINSADQQFAALRIQIDDLLPDQIGPDIDECLLSFNNRFEIIPQIRFGVIYEDEFTPRAFARAYCFEGIAGQIVQLQTLPIPPANLRVFAAISELENPSEFLVVNQANNFNLQTVGPLELPRTTTYLIIVTDLGDVDEEENRSSFGRFALRIADISFVPIIRNLNYNEVTDTLELVDGFNVTQRQEDVPVDQPSVVCPGTGFTCEQLFTCDEAVACFQAGNFALDDNADGTPCGISLCFDRNPADPTGE